MPCLVSLVFDMQSTEGHLYAYNEALGTAARLNGWPYLAVVTTNWQNQPLPPGWIAALERRSFQPGRTPLGKAANLYRLSNSIARVLKRHVLPRNEPAIIFLEHFYPAYLLALLLALRRGPRANLSLWLLYRVNLSQAGQWGHLHRILARIAERMLPPGKLLLLTDSELFQHCLATHFSRPVHVVPVLSYVDIPDDGTSSPTPAATAALDCGHQDGRVVCWWPGPPRARKGLEHMHFLTQLRGPEAQQLCLVAARSAQLAQQHPDGCRVALLDNHLSRAAYVAQLLKSDLILLPYDAAAYAEKTSGIFCEAIIAGKVPAVSEGTWMAHEARRYGLDAVIIPSWDDPVLAGRLSALAHDSRLRQPLATMQRAYRQNNGAQAYARVLQHLWQQ